MHAEITGVVRYPDGSPAAGAIVALGGASPRHRDIGYVTGDGGRYRITGLAPGVYTVQANAAGYGQGTATIAVGLGDVAALDIALEPLG